jgi:hypothetical protein
MKKLMPENSLYWIDKGYSESEANELATKHKGGRYPGNKNYYLLRGITYDVDVAIQLAAEWVTKKCNLTKSNVIKNRFGGDEDAYNNWKVSTCSLSKDNLLKTMTLDEYTKHKSSLGKKLKGKRYSEVDYWTSIGYTNDVAILKVREHAINSTPRRVEYWLSKGMSLDDAINNVSKFQDNTSENSFIQRYGKDDGIMRYQEWIYGQKLGSIRSFHHWVSLGYSKDDSIEIVSNIQKSYANLQPKLPEFWIKKGYSGVDAIVKSKEFARRLSCWCSEYWMDRGYSKDDAINKVSDIQRNNSKLGMKSYGNRKKSKLEIDVSRFFIQREIDHYTDFIVNDVEEGRVYFPDLVFNEFIIEVYGDYWHGNLDIYNENANIIGEMTVKEKHKIDSDRIKRIAELTNKPVFIWWESQIINKGLESLYNNLVKELDENS